MLIPLEEGVIQILVFSDLIMRRTHLLSPPANQVSCLFASSSSSSSSSSSCAWGGGCPPPPLPPPRLLRVANREFPEPPPLENIEIELVRLLGYPQYTYLDDEEGAPDPH